MNDVPAGLTPYLQREILINALYEAAELEHNLMCTYLYAAASLKTGDGEGLSAAESTAVKRWRGVLLGVAIEVMGHLAAVWNITSALGSSPRFGRANFPLDPGLLPAGITVKLAPFNPETLQHFVFLERPHGSEEREGAGFASERVYARGTDRPHLTPMGRDYDTVVVFYDRLGNGLRTFVGRYGEAIAFDGDPALQLSKEEVNLGGCRHVICLKTALAAFNAIIEQGEGAPRDSAGSHFRKFLGIRAELAALTQKNPGFTPAFPAATNPVLRRPPRPEGRVWIEDADAFATVDLANASYALMLRLIAYAYALRGPSTEKSLAMDLAIGLMQAVMPLAERAARLPAGPSSPQCNAGMSFTAPRDSSSAPRSRRTAAAHRALHAARGCGGGSAPDARCARSYRGGAARAARGTRRAGVRALGISTVRAGECCCRACSGHRSSSRCCCQRHGESRSAIRWSGRWDRARAR